MTASASADKIRNLKSEIRTSSADPVLNDLIDELTNRLHAGEPVDLEAYVADHPAHADSLRRFFPALQVLADVSLSGTASFPVATDLSPSHELGSPLAGVLGDFRIIRQIGRGGMGVVYEAEQI